MSVRTVGVGCGAAILRGNRLLLVKRRKPPEAGFWSLPGGKVEFLERAEEAVIREIAEEIGVAIALQPLLCLIQMIGVDGQHWVSPVYRASIEAGEPGNREPDKIAAIGWFALDDPPAPLAIAAREAIAHLRAAIGAPQSPPTSKLTVWYNTKCPVCNAGIDWQRNRLVRAARAGAIEFRDINLEPEALSRFRAGIEDVRRRLHAVDAEGRLYVGADCASAIWLRTPGDAWLGKASALPLIRPIARFVYDRFADLLYAWNRRKGHW
jgi:predicted DCC family thiol-disulfide oxidoreductase YuxK/ADP-ribose pyrophosphatase YjhB (NUDIX family)